MTDRTAVEKLARVFGAMTLEDLRATNKALVGEINKRHRAMQEKCKARLYVGDLIEFVDDKSARKVRARIERINQKTVSCREVDGLKAPLRVSPSLCRLVGS